MSAAFNVNSVSEEARQNVPGCILRLFSECTVPSLDAVGFCEGRPVIFLVLRNL